MIRVIVEDRLAEEVVKQALMTLPDTAAREVFHVEYPSGGADAILKYQIPVLLDTPGHTLILLDGDKQKIDNFIDPDTIPASENGILQEKIKATTGVDPQLTVDGGSGGANKQQLIEIRRKYLAWIRKNVKFIPTLCPEQLVLRAAGKSLPSATTSQHHKDHLRALTVELFGADVSNERTDEHGVTLLASNRSNSPELLELANILTCYLQSARSSS